MAPSFYELVFGFYRAHGVEPRVVQFATQMQTIISLVSAGLGIALVPASLRHLARTGVRYCPLQGDAPVLETGLAWRTDDDTPSLRHFLQLAEAIADDPN